MVSCAVCVDKLKSPSHESKLVSSSGLLGLLLWASQEHCPGRALSDSVGHSRLYRALQQLDFEGMYIYIYIGGEMFEGVRRKVEEDDPETVTKEENKKVFDWV